MTLLAELPRWREEAEQQLAVWPLREKFRRRQAQRILALIDQLEKRTAHQLGYIENGKLTEAGIEHLRAMLPEGWELREL